MWSKNNSWPKRQPGSIRKGSGGSSSTAAVQYGNRVKTELELKLQRSIETNNERIAESTKPVFEPNILPEPFVDPGEYQHLFDDQMTDYSRVTTSETMPDYGDDDY